MTGTQIICTKCDRRIPIDMLQKEADARIAKVLMTADKASFQLQNMMRGVVVREFRMFGCEALSNVLPPEEARHDATD